MEKDLKKVEPVISPDEARRSKIAVAGIIALILAGMGIWGYLEFSADVIVDRDTAKLFAARFEKSCQASRTPDVCRRIAGMNHQTCFEKCVQKAEGKSGVEYDVDTYLSCMGKAQAEFTGAE